MTDELARLPFLLGAHVRLTMLALLVATLVSVPLGIAATRARWLERLALGVAGVIQTIPGLALLAVMVPLLAALGASGIGPLPALIGLSLYCILPVLMATVTGIREVDGAMLEAADAVGMRPSERLRLVELPLAMPVIVSGVRTATVWCVGMATLSTPIGAPSLGDYIFGGLQTRNYAAVLVGCAAAAVLAVVLDRVVELLEVGIRKRRRPFVVVAGVVLLALYGYTGFALAVPSLDRDEAPLRIGAKTFTEQYVLAAILAEQVRARTGRRVETLASLGSTVAFDALAAGDIDAYVDYSGTIWATVLDRGAPPAERERVIATVREQLAREHGIEIAAVLGFENTYALALRRDRARALGARRISDLARNAPSLVFGGDFELFSRPEWATVRRVYGLAPGEERAMDPSLMYQAVERGAVDVIGAYSTDGRIDALDLAVLEDDRRAIPPYDAIVLVRAGLSRDSPAVVDAIRELEGAIDAATMRRMNAAVDESGRRAEDVARQWHRDRR